MAKIRLDKYLADAGMGTRSSVKATIKGGAVEVNDAVIRVPDYKVDTELDTVKYKNKPLRYNQYEYYMLHKPQGVVSATSDKRDKTVIELIDCSKRRDLFPVGRLDKDTEGLLLITNDGKLANLLMAPTKHVKKTYFARIQGRVTEHEIEKFKNGIDIGDDKLTKDAELKLLLLEEGSDDYAEVVSTVEITITEGRYHQIKRMFEAVGMSVLYLKRISVGPIALDESLECGSYRALTASEVELLKGVRD